MVMDYLVYLNFFMFGWIACQFYTTWKLRQALKKVAEENGMSLEEMAEKYFAMNGVNVIKVPNYFTETNGNSILLYNKDTGDFISQACNIEELADNVYKFNKVKFALVNHDNTQVWFVEGKVENDIKNIE
jgi:hypothetical protein